MLNDFSSVFEILALANAGYTGSKSFRGAINNPLHHSLVDPISNRLERLKNEIKLIKAQGRDIGMPDMTELGVSSMSEVTRNLEIIHTIQKQKADSRNFVSDFRTIFLMVFIFCSEVMVLGGFEQFYDGVVVARVLSFLNLQSVFILLYFSRNLLINYTPRLRISALYVLLFIALPIGLYFLDLKGVGAGFFSFFRIALSDKANLSIAIVTGLSAYLLFLMRAFIHVLWYGIKLRQFKKSVETDLRNYSLEAERKLSSILNEDMPERTDF